LSAAFEAALTSASNKVQLTNTATSPPQAFAKAARYAENTANSQITFAKAARYETSTCSPAVACSFSKRSPAPRPLQTIVEDFGVIAIYQITSTKPL
jgi:hypothetical protein